MHLADKFGSFLQIDVVNGYFDMSAHVRLKALLVSYGLVLLAITIRYYWKKQYGKKESR